MIDLNILTIFINEPYNDMNNFNLGYEYDLIGQTAIALSYYLRCAEYTSNDNLSYECLLRMSKCLSKQGNREFKELTCLEHAISIRPDRPEAYYIMSLYHSFRGNWLKSYMYACIGLESTDIQNTDIQITDLQNSNKLIKDIGYYSYNQLLFQKAYSGYNKGKLKESKMIYLNLLESDIKDTYKDIIKGNLTNFTDYKQDDNVENKYKGELNTIFQKGYTAFKVGKTNEFKNILDSLLLNRKLSKELRNIINKQYKIYFKENDYNILGNGPSLKSIDITKLKGFTIGTCLAYRYWYSINWFPDHYCICDEIVFEHNIEDIKKMIIENKCKSYFLPINIKLLWKEYIEYENILIIEDELKNINIDRTNKVTCDTGAIAALYAYILNASDIKLYGIDCNYIECIKESVMKNNIKMEVVNDIESNPNYFIENYQLKGDLYSKPNISDHILAWKELKQIVKRTNINVNNIHSKIYNIFSGNNEYYEDCIIINNIPELIVIDNFYKDPDSIRKKVLDLEFLSEDYHGAVGNRCEKGRLLTDEAKDYFEKLLGKKIKIGNDIGEWSYSTNGCFQWCSKDTRIVYHSDSQEYAGIVFLTPDAPVNCGTSIFRHKKYKIKDNSIWSKSDWSDGNIMNDPHLDKNLWEEVDRIGNIYNRLILFKSHNVHAVSEYFGETINDSRLFQLFFFDIE